MPQMQQELALDLEQALAELPVLDVHTHLVGGKLAARGLHDVLLYHMVVSDLYAAGCPSGARLTQYPGWPTSRKPTRASRRRSRSAADPQHQLLANGASHPARPVRLGRTDHRRQLAATGRDDSRAGGRSVLASRDSRSAAHRTGRARRSPVAKGAWTTTRLQYSLEWAFFTRCQWGEFDTALYELERCWGSPPEPPSPIGPASAHPARRAIRTPRRCPRGHGRTTSTRIPYRHLTGHRDAHLDRHRLSAR